MKIKRASGVKRVLYGSAAAGALLASSVSADEVTGKLSTTETEKTIMSKDGSASTNNVLQTVQLSTSGSQPLPEGSKIVITLTPKQTISRIASQFRQKDVSLVDTKLKYIDNYHYELDVSGTEPGKLRDYVFDLGNYVSSIRDLDFGVTYDLTIGGKSVSKVDTMLHVRKEVTALNLEDASGSYNQVTDGKQVIKSSYENGKANVGNLSLKEMTKAVENAVGRYTNMTLDVTVPENVTLRSEQFKADGTKTIGHNALAKYRSGNTYHIPFSELDGRSDKFVYDAIDYYFDGEPLVDKSQLPMDEAKTTSTVFDNIVVGAHYSDDKSLSSSITAQAPIKFTLWANTRPLSEGLLQMAVTSDVLSNVATYEKPSMNVRLSVKGELPVSFSESTDITLTDSPDLRRRKLTISGGVKTRFVVKDAKTQTVLKELGSNESYVVPDTVDKITITPKDKISIYDWESTVKPKDAETGITYTFDVSSADDVALTKRLTRTPEIVNQISAKVDGMSDGATHSLYKSKVRVQLQNNEQFYFLTKNGQGANIGNDALSGDKPVMSPLTLLEEFTPSFRSNDLRKLSKVIQNAQFKMTLPEGVSVIPDNSAFKVVSQNGRDVILSMDKENSKWYQSYDYGKDNTIDGLLKFALNVPYKAATYRIPFEMISHSDDVADEGSVKKSILTITTATVREALSTSDVDNNGEAVTDFVLSNGNFVTVHSNLTNATQAPINKWESLAYIPQKGIEGSTATAKLKGAITAPKGWKVLYTTDKVSGNREADGKLNFTETLSDFSRVTAVKYVATEPVVKSSTVTFNIPLETPNEPGAKYVYRTDITTDTVSHILSAPVSISAKEAELKTRYLEKGTDKVLSPEEKGKKDKKDIPDYTFVETKVDGNVTTHYYTRELKTRYLEKGTDKVLSPEEKGKKDKKDIPDYTFVETKVDGNVTTHYYTKELKTRYLEKDTDKVLSPEEKGKHDKKDIPDYTFVETKVDGNVTTHYYTKELKTRYLEQGTNKVLSPEEKGKKDKKAIPDYTFVETKTDGNVTTHYYTRELKTRYLEEGTNKVLSPEEKGKKDKKDIPTYHYVRTTTEGIVTTHYYTQVYTRYIDIADGKEIAEREKGTFGKKDIPEYRYVDTQTDDKGNTTHRYEQVGTQYIDKSTGKEIASREKGTKPKKDIPEYRFVETKKDKDGNTKHYYEQVVTRHVAKEDGHEVAPMEKGTTAKKDNIPDYRYVETKKDPNGDTRHIYEMVETHYIDKKTGKDLTPPDKGTKGKKDIPGYRFVETRKTPNGNTEHVYEHVNTRHVDLLTGKELSPMEEGLTEKRQIPDYVYVETRMDPNGDRRHLYSQQATRYLDKDTLKELAKTEKGTHPKRDFPDYRFVETKVDGVVTTHYYEQVETRFIDKETGKSISDPKKGTHGKKDIPGYRFVETRKTPNGDTEHVYEQLMTRHIDKATGKELTGAEKGLHGSRTFPGYHFVETKTDPNGDLRHFYAQVVTKHVDILTGEEVAKSEQGIKPKKDDIPNYRYIETSKDGDGNIIHKYRQVVTRFVDRHSGAEIAPFEKGTTPKKNIPDYRYYETTRDDNGNTRHVYEQITTRYIDKVTGKDLLPFDKGTKPKKDIPEYRFDHTEKLPNGDTKHYYVQVVTRHVDVDTKKELAEVEKGTQPKRTFDGYYFVETKTDNGDTTHYYKQVVTRFVDKSGKDLVPSEKGKKDKKDIPDYRYVETKVDEKGNITHIYESVPKPEPKPEPEKPVVDKPVVNKELPHTGDMAEMAQYGLGLASLGLVGLARTALARRKKD